MSVSPAREAAYRILSRVESGRAFAVDLLHKPMISSLRDKDRRLATELVMGTLRWKGELDFWIECLSGKRLSTFDPVVATILRLGIYQIRFLNKVPKSAAVNEAVEMAKFLGRRSAAGLVNALLRKCEPDKPPSGVGKSAQPRLSPHEERLESACRALPTWLRERWTRHFGRKGMQDLAWASSSIPPVTLRVCAADREEVARRLAEEGVQARLGRWASHSLVVQSGNVQSTEVMSEGLVVIQDEASQLVGELLAPQPGERVIDLCAAPGIKTGQLAKAQGSGLLVACDLSGHRLRTLKRLLLGHLPGDLRLLLVRLDARCELPFRQKFNRILVDAPCSGTGTLARNPEIKWQLKPADLVRFPDVQTAILRNAQRVLAPGGRLVYATCSLEPEENEQVVGRALAACPGFRVLRAPDLSREFPALIPFFGEDGFFRTRPDLHEMDGFFAAVLTTA